MTKTDQLVKYILDTSYEDISANGIKVAKQCFLDWIGVAIGAQPEEVVAILKEEFNNEKEDYGLVGGGTASLYNSCIVNGTAGHVLDYDDGNKYLFGHPSVTLFPALIALSQELKPSAKEFLTAFVVGYETGCRISSMVGRQHYLVGYHATVTFGTFSVAAACAKLLGLNQEQTKHALNIASCQASGIKQMFGSHCKSYQVGKAAMNGLLSARLAAKGMTGGEQGIEGKQGFINTHHGENADMLELPPGKFVEDTLFKYHAACHMTHSAIEIMHELRERGVQASDISSIQIAVPKTQLDMCNIQEPATALETKFSLRHTAAMALHGVDTSALDVYSKDSAFDQQLINTRQKVTVIGDVQFGSHADVSVHLNDGTTQKIWKDVVKPGEDLDLQQEKLETKFRALVSDSLGEDHTEILVSQVRSLEQLESLEEILNIIFTSPKEVT